MAKRPTFNADKRRREANKRDKKARKEERKAERRRLAELGLPDPSLLEDGETPDEGSLAAGQDSESDAEDDDDGDEVDPDDPASEDSGDSSAAFP